MDWIIPLQTLCLLASMAGAVLNAKQDIRGFYLWGFSNVSWTIIAIEIQQPILALQYVFFSGTVAYGLWSWRRKPNVPDSKEAN